ncbi:RNase adapter RapZ [Chitiniphilus purpureus]|uniref:RNase adapter RapZ n=1 Tax=Chitiniphilus purpureus TaxID=2981137 RepID=A0ABY6DLN6_9NEIS|nr:RNase adapter RapZ [Chitiniphilus sp. CD1]UXY15280.1 RNase adapter RapZ [Chitiniphilus sp. CD1]
MPQPRQQVVLLSGLSGAGKSVALKALEDLGYYCIDNLPAPLLPQTVALLDEDGYPRVAIAIDVRSAHSFASFPEHLDALFDLNLDIQLLFLESKTETLVKRFSETRRSHPLASGELTVFEAIALEREMLAYFSSLAHRIDTTALSAAQLRAWLRGFVALDRARLTLIFESFGFKQGIPLDADFVFDARCLPNPHYEPALRPLTGCDQPVIDFLEREEAVSKYLTHILGFLERWLPEFERDQRSYVTVAIGCTGGQHRSVYLAEQLARHFSINRQVLVRHRERPELATAR